MRVQSGQQCRARRAAPCRVIELSESHAVARKLVEVWGRNFTAIAARSEKPTSSTSTMTMFGRLLVDESAAAATAAR